MLVICGGGYPRLNVLSANRSSQLNMLNEPLTCFKCNKVIVPKWLLWLVILLCLGLHVNVLSTKRSPCLNVVFRWWWTLVQYFKSKKVTTLNVGYVGWWGTHA